MKKKILVVTTSRADYGLLKNLLIQIRNDINLELDLVVSGTHLSNYYGNTYKEILKDGLIINKKIKILEENKFSKTSLSKSSSILLEKLTNYILKNHPDIMVLLGDRFEILSCAQAGLLCDLPIAHIHGGETTFGVIDECVRHALTKISNIHFVSTNEYKFRVIQMGENPKNVFHTGAPGLDNLKSINFLSKKKLVEKLKIQMKPFFLITLHPITRLDDTMNKYINNILNVLSCYKNYNLIFTKANSDFGGKKINDSLRKFCRINSSYAYLFESLGQTVYLSALKYAEAIIGNSSSGIIEAPSLNTPTINIGERQEGRACSKSIIHSSYKSVEIKKSIDKVISSKFKKKLKNYKNPYGNPGNISLKIKNVLKNIKINNFKKKIFFDIKLK